jgi:hypothetical protein
VDNRWRGAALGWGLVTFGVLCWVMLPLAAVRGHGAQVGPLLLVGAGFALSGGGILLMLRARTNRMGRP